jgi:trimeric autotransporter adhesin
MNNVAEWVGDHWAPLDTGIDGEVRAITVVNGNIFVGGDFTTAGGTTSPGIAEWSAGRWQSMGGLDNQRRDDPG